MKTAHMLSGLAAVLLTSSAMVLAQRVQFATPIESQPSPPTSAAPVVTSPPSTTYGQPATPSPYPSPSPPALLSPPPSTYSPPGATFGPSNNPYSSPTYTPPPGLGFPPPAALGGTTQPPAANWDPYATPGGAPGALLPQDPYCQSAGGGIGMASMQKFMQQVNFDYGWFAGHGNNELGINDVSLSATFAFPLFYNTQTPLLATPGFAIHYWEGPVSVLPVLPTDPPPADLPARTYDAYLDFAWNPQVTPWFGGELNFRTGIYSDFNRVTSDSLRFMGKGMAVLVFSPSVKVKVGAWYLDRNRVKILPAGGICWTPNPDVYFDVLFPNPKMGKRLTTWGNTEWWLYAAGDYGGDAWTIKRDSGFPPGVVATDGTYDSFDYNDIRIAVGLEFQTVRQFKGYFEVGLATSRELVYRSGSPEVYYPRNTVFLGAGMAY